MPHVKWVAVAFAVGLACSKATEPRGPWAPPPEPSWGPLPKTDDEARALVARETTPNQARSFDLDTLAMIRPDASKLVVGEDEIAAAYDGWVGADPKKPTYLVFGTLHDSRAQLEAVTAIVVRMRQLWGLALEQLHAAGSWSGAPLSSHDDEDLALLAKPGAPDDGALFRIAQRQARWDHAAWKFDYLPAIANLLYEARGAGLPVFGCDMPPELRKSFTPGSPADSGLRELHCVRSLRARITALAPPHADAGLFEDDEPPPERFAVVVGANHAAPDGLPRFFKKGTRFALVRVLGGHPADAQAEESARIAARLVVLDPVVVRSKGPDALLLPDATWGGDADRTTDPDVSAQPTVPAGLPRPNVVVTSDEPGRFAVGESSIDVTSKPEWLTTRAGHDAFVLVAPSLTMLGAVDVPPGGYAELRFAPKTRSVRIVVHAPS